VMATEHPRAPRLAPASPDRADERTRRAFGTVAPYGAPTNPVLGTLMLHPELAELYMPFSDYLKNQGRLSPRDRRLAIMRTAWNCGADYQWVAHAGYARTAGVPDEEIERIAAGAEASGWDAPDVAVLRAADELHADRCVSASTWAQLSDRLDARSLVELVMLVGNYQMIALLMNTVGIAPAEDPPNLPGNSFARWSAPTQEDAT
jgi:4-carboxymuconolactone decarboxylase